MSKIFGGGSSKAKVADYRISMHIGVCLGPVDAVNQVYFNEKASTGSIAKSSGSYIYNPQLFGGDQQGGGVAGNVAYYFGEATQVLDPFLKGKMGDPKLVPSFRGLCTLFFYGPQGDGFLIGTNTPYLPPIAVKVQDLCHVLDDNSAIGTDVNPAHLIYECMTDTSFGKGEDPAKMDAASYLAAAKQLRSEGLGLSILWDAQSSIEDFINNILDQINAKHDIHPLTGLWTLKLLRQDYDVTTLFVLDETNSELSNYQSKLYGEIPNVVTVEWINPLNEQIETVTSYNDASIAIQGAQIAITQSFHGVRSSALAQKLADRELKAASLQLVSGSSKCQRSAYGVFPGDVVKINYPGQSVQNLIARVITIDRGTPGSDEITIEWTQDVFGVQYSDFDDVTSDFNGGGSEPIPVSNYKIWTAPYYAVAVSIGDSSAQNLAYPTVYVAPLAAAPTVDTRLIDYYVSHVNSVGDEVLALGGSITPTGLTTSVAALPLETTSIIKVITPTQMGQVGDFILIEDGINEELCAIAAIGTVSATDLTPTYTLYRGILDTVPRAWPTTANLWSISQSNNPLDPSQHMVGETAEYQFLPYTPLGRLDIASSPVDSGVLTDRLYRPLPNTNVVANGGQNSYNVVQGNGLPVTWNRRNRITQTSQILQWTDPDVPPEDGQTTTVSIVNAAGAVVQSYTGLSGTSFSITDFGSLPAGSAAYTISVKSSRAGFDSYTSWVSQPIAITK